MSNKLTFGKYKDKTVEDVIDIDPNYILWVRKNVAFFTITDEELDKAKNKALRPKRRFIDWHT